MRILGISGSLRRDSHNTRLLRAAALALPPGAELVHYRDLAAIPPFNEDHENLSAPEPVRALRAAAGLGRRPALQYSRVQRLGSRSAQERGRLGLASISGQLAA